MYESPNVNIHLHIVIPMCINCGPLTLKDVILGGVYGQYALVMYIYIATHILILNYKSLIPL